MMYKTKPSTLRRVAACATIPALFAGVALVNTSAVASVLSEARGATVFSNTPEFFSQTGILMEDQEFVAESVGKVTTFSEDKDKNLSEKIIPSASSDKSEQVAEAVDKSYIDDSNSVKHSDSVPEGEFTHHPSQSAGDQMSDKEDDEESPYASVEHMAEFPGGQKEMMKFLQDNIKYPENARKKDIQGRVIVKFIITKNGKIESPKIVRGIDAELDSEAIRVISSMPDWIPAKNMGQPVASWFTLPVAFRLPDPEAATDR